MVYTGGRPAEKKEELVDGAAYDIEKEDKIAEDKEKKELKVAGIEKALKDGPDLGYFGLHFTWEILKILRIRKMAVIIAKKVVTIWKQHQITYLPPISNLRTS